MASSLVIEVCKIKEIKEHKNSDNLEIAVIKGWECIVKKEQYKTGDLVVYIPPDSVLPIELAEQLGVRNYLGGKDKNRVRCARLRGEMSFGLIINNEGNWEEGTDVREFYKIEKYDPPIRALAGDAAPSDPLFLRYTDIENLRNYTDIIKEGEEVVITEKCDGTNCKCGWSRNEDGTIELKAGSMGLKRRKPAEEEMATNIYWFPHTVPSVKQLLEDVLNNEQYNSIKTFTIYGEVYGRVRGGHKSLHYGKPNKLGFVVFDIQIDGNYIDYHRFKMLCDLYHLPIVPVLHNGPFSMEIVKSLSRGNSKLAEFNGAEHMREGIVVKPIHERMNGDIGRVVLKFLNDDYLELKNKKEAKGEEVDFKDE